jgi:hypothetical protein
VLLARAALVGSVLVLAGCPAHDLPACHVVPADGGAVGGGSNAVEAVLVAAGEDGALIEIHDGSPVPLVSAPQGGHIMLVGAKLKGSSDCMLDATGALRDPTSGRVIGLDERALLLSTGSGGWSQPSDPPLSSMPNVAVCPSSAATLSVDGNPYTLELTLRDGSTTVATLTATVTPTCAAGDGYCHTDCTPTP